MCSCKRPPAWWVAAFSLCCSSRGFAQAPESVLPSAAAAEPEPTKEAKPPPYSLPWQLRPVVAGNIVRADTAIAFYEVPSAAPNAGEKGSTIVSMLLLSYKVAEGLAPLVRVGVVSSSPPDSRAAPVDSALGFLNPVIGATYAWSPLPPLRIGLFLGLTAPIGSGAGNDPKPENVVANGAGILARSAMDNAMFAVNYFTVFPGVGIAYVDKGFTAQVEATLLQLTRVRGDQTRPDGLDDSRTNFTTGLHLGYFILPPFSLGAEIRHQRWLSTPTPVKNDTTNTLRDNTTVAFGPRFHIQLREKMWLRPGVALALPLDNPMKDRNYKVVQIDVPFVF